MRWRGAGCGCGELMELQGGCLCWITVAEITSALRGSQAEVTIGTEAGLKHPSSVNLINVQTVPRAHLAHYVGAVSPEAMHRVCEALRVATGC